MNLFMSVLVLTDWNVKQIRIRFCFEFRDLLVAMHHGNSVKFLIWIKVILQRKVSIPKAIRACIKPK
jgi:hypothetical protein